MFFFFCFLYLLYHKKEEHPNIVSVCKNEAECTCKYESLRCWFKQIKTKELKSCEKECNRIFKPIETHTK
jgi:hypothetical protein